MTRCPCSPDSSKLSDRGVPAGPSRRAGAGVAVEQLDHRQLLSVNFTGNVPVDFPATQSPGVVVLPDNPSVIQPSIPRPAAECRRPRLGLRHHGHPCLVRLDQRHPVLRHRQPASGNAGQGEVIAGDADDNGNSGTVNPAIPAIRPANRSSSLHGFPGLPRFPGHRVHGGLPGLHRLGDAAGRRRLLRDQSDPAIRRTNPVPNRRPSPMRSRSPIPADLPVFGTPLPQFTGTRLLAELPDHAQPRVLDHPLLAALPDGDG